MTPTLSLGPGLTLPPEAITETFVILAKRGSGKTYTAAVMAEEMLDAGLPVCVIDPIGVWWGLRSSADGRGEGYPVVIFGGEHADVPLEGAAGQLIADVIIDQRFPAVLDLSLLSKSASRRFMTDFLARMYHRNRDPLHVIIDEADLFAPQTGGQRGGDAPALLGAMEDLVRRGRARGIGATLITQRPAVLHKDVLSQAEVLIALRMTGVRDVGAIDEWVKLHAEDETARDLKKSLPALPIGTAWVWSPGWLGILQKVAVRKRRTFDSSATPKMGERRMVPKRMADVDLAALGEQIAATVERAKAEDPKTLRAEVARLKRELESAQSVQPETVTEQVEVPVLDGDLVKQVVAASGPLAEALRGVQEALSRWQAPAGAPAPVRRPAERPAARVPAPARRQTAEPAGDVHLKAGARRILLTLAQHHPMRVTRAQLGTLAKFKVTGGTFQTYWGVLKREGLVDESGGDIGITQAGLDYVGADVPEPLTTEEVLAQWRSALKAGARNMLDHLVAVYPAGTSREDLAEAVGMTVTGGTFQTYLGTLRRNGLVDVEAGEVRASGSLFLGVS